MSSLNKAQVIGYLGKDAELKYTPSGTPVSTISLATSERWTDKETGKPQEKTEWHRIVIWGKQAETLAQYLEKGKQIYVEGRLQTREWEDKDGQKRWTTEIRADRVLLLGKSDHAGSGPQSTPHPAEGTTDDDIPF